MTKDELEEKANYYRNIIKNINCMENESLEGTLRISVDGKKVRYYYRSEQFLNGERYLHKGETELSRKLAQKDYNEKIFKLAKKRLGQIERLVKDYDSHEIDNLYDQLHSARKCLVQPVEKTIEQKYADWLTLEYQGKSFVDGATVIMTEKGERVRSKTEKIMADYFYGHNIEYKYEKPLHLNGMGIVHPDFTFFSKESGKEIYWEHDGRMDDPEYARRAVRKIEVYEENGILLGERLIITFETSEKVLSTKEIKRTIERFKIGKN